MSYAIHELFPKPVYIKDNACSEEGLQQGLNYILRRHKEQQELSTDNLNTPLFDCRSSVDWEINMHEAEEMKPVVDTILESAREFAVELGFPNASKNIFIRDMFSLLQDANDFLHFHTHQGAFISGAFYFTAPSDSTIIFKSFEDNFRMAEKWNKINSLQKSFDIKGNQIIMFRSNLIHGIPRCTEDGKVLATFNIVMDPADMYGMRPGNGK